MAIYHAHIKNFSRGKGDSATAAAAYRAGLDIVDTRTRITHRYSRRLGVISHHMLAPAGAPQWCNDPSVFFDACERWEKRVNGIVARELEVALPSELHAMERQALALSLGQILVDRYRVVVLVAIHGPSGEGDQRNHHTHLLMSPRELGPDGFGGRAASEFEARGGKGAQEVRALRILVNDRINEALGEAGRLERVDHRSLRVQSMAARAAGEFEKAAELDRPATRHIGKALTVALRRGSQDPLLVKAKIIQSPAQKAMEEAEADFARQGRLMSTPVADGAQAARADRVRETLVPMKSAESASPAFRPLGRMPSTTALQLGRLMRIGKAQGKDAEVLNAEARLIEEWLVAQNEASRAALASLQAIVGLQLEPQLKRAVEVAQRRRIGIYGTKRFFFEDSEALTGAIEEYAAAILHPHQMREEVRRALARRSEVIVDGKQRGHARLVSATRALARARLATNKIARNAFELRIKEARAVMVAATEAMERDYYVTPLDRIETCPPHPYTAGPGGGERKSDSNRREFKPPSRSQP